MEKKSSNEAVKRFRLTHKRVELCFTSDEYTKIEQSAQRESCTVGEFIKNLINLYYPVDK